MTLTPDSDDADVRSRMNSLEEEVNDVIDRWTEVIELIEVYRRTLQTVYSWFDTIIKQLEKCDRVEYPDSNQRNEEINKLWSKFKETQPKVDQLSQKANEIKPHLSNLDNQQVDEQLRSVQKRYNDLKKRVNKKQQIVQMTRKGYDDSKNNIEELCEWLNERSEYLDALPLLGYSSANVERRISEFNVSFYMSGVAKDIYLDSLQNSFSSDSAETFFYTFWTPITQKRLFVVCSL